MLKFLEKVHPPHVSHVICHMSGVRCQVSGVRCQVSGVTCFFIIFFFDKKVELVGEGLVSTGPAPSSLLNTFITIGPW